MITANNCTVSVPQSSDAKLITPLLKQGLRKAIATVSLWQAKASQRRKLKMLLNDPDALKDIGVSAWDASVEANKPFWK